MAFGQECEPVFLCAANQRATTPEDKKAPAIARGEAMKVVRLSAKMGAAIQTGADKGNS
jgi:hypothetical protein